VKSVIACTGNTESSNRAKPVQRVRRCFEVRQSLAVDSSPLHLVGSSGRTPKCLSLGAIESLTCRRASGGGPRGKQCQGEPVQTNFSPYAPWIDSRGPTTAAVWQVDKSSLMCSEQAPLWRGAFVSTDVSLGVQGAG